MAWVIVLTCRAVISKYHGYTFIAGKITELIARQIHLEDQMLEKWNKPAIIAFVKQSLIDQLKVN